MDARTGGRRLGGEAAIALALLAIAAFLAIETFSIRVSPSYARVGPRVIPLIVAAGLGAVGLTLLAQALAGYWRAAPETAPRRVLPLAVVGLGLAMHALLLTTAGFIAASTVLFVCVTLAFGSRALLRDAAGGLLLSAAIFFAFTRLLRVDLPVGTLWGAG